MKSRFGLESSHSVCKEHTKAELGIKIVILGVCVCVCVCVCTGEPTRACNNDLKNQVNIAKDSGREALKQRPDKISFCPAWKGKRYGVWTKASSWLLQ